MCGWGGDRGSEYDLVGTGIHERCCCHGDQTTGQLTQGGRKEGLKGRMLKGSQRVQYSERCCRRAWGLQQRPSQVSRGVLLEGRRGTAPGAPRL